MKAAILQPSGGYLFREVMRPSFGPQEVLIRVLVCGVCTSDMGAWKHGLGHEEIMGHEVVGIVEEMGQDVIGYQRGQRVTGAIMKGYAEYTVASYHDLLPVPESFAPMQAIVEPFSCMISGIARANITLGSRVAVVGTGFMGLSLLYLLKAAGATHLTAVDLSPVRRAFAKAFGADQVFTQEQAQEYCTAEEIPFVFEAAGSASALELAAQMCGRHGVLGIVGYHPCRRDIDMALWNGKALTVINAFEYRKAVQLRNMAAALDLVQADRLPIKKLITHCFPFDQLEQAFLAHQAKADGYLKSYVFME